MAEQQVASKGTLRVETNFFRIKTDLLYLYKYSVSIEVRKNGEWKDLFKEKLRILGIDQSILREKLVNWFLREYNPNVGRKYTYNVLSIVFTDKQIDKNRHSCPTKYLDTGSDINLDSFAKNYQEIRIVMTQMEKINVGNISASRQNHRERGVFKHFLEILLRHGACNDAFRMLPNGLVLASNAEERKGVVDIHLGFQKGTRFIESDDVAVAIDTGCGTFFANAGVSELSGGEGGNPANIKTVLKYARLKHVEKNMDFGKDTLVLESNDHYLRAKWNSPAQEKTYSRFPLDAMRILPRWQQVPRALRDRKEIKMECIPKPETRFKRILNFSSIIANYSQDLLQAFNFQAMTRLPTMDAKTRSPPDIFYGTREKAHISEEKATWKPLKQDCKYSHPARIHTCWIKCSYSGILSNFAGKLTTHCKMRGIELNKLIETNASLVELGQTIQLERSNCKAEEKLFLIHIDGANNTHGELKLFEMKNRIVTQHIRMQTAEKITDSNFVDKMGILENIVAKLNCKNGGQCYTVSPDVDKIRKVIWNNSTLIIGYDVCHPRKASGQDRKPFPSVIGVSFNGTEHFETFIGDYAFQTPCQEEVDASVLKRWMKLILDRFMTHHARLPSVIIIVRDGVSESQFEMVRNREMNTIRGAIKTRYRSVKFVPKFLCVVACKRHHKRFFIDGGKSNCPPSTVIDTTIVRSEGDEFFMQAHNAIMGTAKVPAYTVLINEMQLSMNEIQSIMMALCYSHQIVRKAVSIPEPVYQADEWAKRGRDILTEMITRGLDTTDYNQNKWNSLTDQTCYIDKIFDVRVNA